jgi:hypothetical protein
MSPEDANQPPSMNVEDINDLGSGEDDEGFDRSAET